MISVDEIKVSIGQFVAIYHTAVFNRVKRLPLIGRVTNLQEENDLSWVEIELWQGSYSGKWSRPKKPLLEWLTKESVILYDFALTDKNKLRNSTKLRLKEVYLKYVNCSGDEDSEDED